MTMLNGSVDLSIFFAKTLNFFLTIPVVKFKSISRYQIT